MKFNILVALVGASKAIKLVSEGPPVYVDPSLIENTLGDADLQQRDYIMEGINGISFVQLIKEEKLANDNLVVLHVNGEARGIDT